MGRTGRSGQAPQRAREGGFTLVELLLVVVILGVVAGAIGGAFTASIHDSKGVNARFVESHDAQETSAYLATDVQSAVSIVASPCGGNVIALSRSDGTVVSYWSGPQAGEQRLTRSTCSGATVTSVAVLSHHVASTPTVACVADCNVGTKPTKVSITVTEHNPETGANDYTYTLTGAVRVQTSNVAGTTTPFPPLLSLATSGTGVSVSGNGSLTVNGTGLVSDSTSSSAVSVPNHNASLTGTVEIVSPGQCSGQACPATTSRQQPVPDPFAGLAIPSESGLPVFTDGNPAHGPGVYRTVPLSFPNGNTTLAPGTYIVEAGFSFSGQANVVGDGVLLFNGCGGGAPAGCQNTGTFSVAGQNSISLDATTAGANGMALWQPAANTQPITINGKGNMALGGVLYAPGSSMITLGAGNGNVLTVKAVIGKAITVTGNGTVQVG